MSIATSLTNDVAKFLTLYQYPRPVRIRNDAKWRTPFSRSPQTDPAQNSFQRLKQLGWTFRRGDETLGTFDREAFEEHYASYAADGPQGQSEVVHGIEQLHNLAYFESGAEVGQVADESTARLAMSLHADGWSGGINGWQAPSSAAGVYQTLMRDESHVGLTLWKDGTRLVTLRTGGRTRPDSPVVSRLRDVTRRLPDLSKEFGLEGAGQVLGTIFAGKESPDSQLTTLRTLYATAPNQRLARLLVNKVTDPELRQFLVATVFPFARQEGWDSEERFDRNDVCLAVAEHLKDQPDRDQAWSDMVTLWDSLPEEMPHSDHRYRNLLNLSFGRARIKPERLLQELESIGDQIAGNPKPGEARAIAISLRNQTAIAGLEVDSELPLIKDMSRRLQACPKGNARTCSAPSHRFIPKTIPIS